MLKDDLLPQEMLFFYNFNLMGLCKWPNTLLESFRFQ